MEIATSRPGYANPRSAEDEDRSRHAGNERAPPRKLFEGPAKVFDAEAADDDVLHPESSVHPDGRRENDAASAQKRMPRLSPPPNSWLSPLIA